MPALIASVNLTKRDPKRPNRRLSLVQPPAATSSFIRLVRTGATEFELQTSVVTYRATGFEVRPAPAVFRPAPVITRARAGEASAR